MKKTLLWLLQQFAGAVITGVVTAVALIIAGPIFLQNLTDSFPSCSRPVGLKRVQFQETAPPEVLARGDQITSSSSFGDGSTVRGDHAPYRDDTSTDTDESLLFAPENAFDQSVASSWAVRRSDMAAGSSNTLTLDVASDHDVVLACATNGSAVSNYGYQRADRVHEMQIDTTCGTSTTSRVVYLRSMPEESIQEAQDLNLQCRKLQQITLTIKTSYIGQDVTNSDGKSEKPTQRVALADLALYELGSDATWIQRFEATV